jgi:hypothetical protein
LSNSETIKGNDWINQGVILKGGESAAESTLPVYRQAGAFGANFIVDDLEGFE